MLCQNVKEQLKLEVIFPPKFMFGTASPKSREHQGLKMRRLLGCLDGGAGKKCDLAGDEGDGAGDFQSLSVMRVSVRPRSDLVVSPERRLPPPLSYSSSSPMTAEGCPIES